MVRMSAPFSQRWVAQECLNVRADNGQMPIRRPAAIRIFHAVCLQMCLSGTGRPKSMFLRKRPNLSFAVSIVVLFNTLNTCSVSHVARFHR
jgi:hypothetical protein